MARGHGEHTLQQAVATFLARALPPDAWWTSIDHGAGKMDLIAGAIRKSRGVKRGIPDVIILHDGRFVGIELKTAAGTVSDSQRTTANEILAAGGTWEVCRSVEQVEGLLRHRGIPLRAGTMAPAEYDERLAERALAPKKPRKPRAEPADRRWLEAMERARAKGIFA